MKHLSNDYEDRPNQHENYHLCEEKGHPVLSLKESQWTLIQEHDHDFPMKVKPLYNKYQRQKKKEIEKSRTMRITVIVPSSKVNNHGKVI